MSGRRDRTPYKAKDKGSDDEQAKKDAKEVRDAQLTVAEIMEQLRKEPDPLQKAPPSMAAFLRDHVLRTEDRRVHITASPVLSRDYYLGWGSTYFLLSMALVALPILFYFVLRASYPVGTQVGVAVGCCLFLWLTYDWAGKHNIIVNSYYVITEARFIRIVNKGSGRKPTVESLPLEGVSGLKIDADGSDSGHLIFNYVSLPEPGQPLGPTNFHFAAQWVVWHIPKVSVFYRVMRVCNIMAKRKLRGENMVALGLTPPESEASSPPPIIGSGVGGRQTGSIS